MRKKSFLGAVILLCGISLLLPIKQSFAATDTRLRQELEGLLFGEYLIRSSLYPVSRSDVYHRGKRKFVHGLSRVNAPFIYEPDVYTWELAMAAHRRHTPRRIAQQGPGAGYVSPSPMIPSNILPAGPGEVQLTPLGSNQMLSSAPLPANHAAQMNQMLNRAQVSGINAGGQLRAGSIKQRLLQHLNSLSQRKGTTYPQSLPGNLPRGRAADSFDRKF